MKVTGIIAEYNPFHNGHLYHIQSAKAQTKADYVIVVMSGNFTQRGIPAILSKYERAKHALLSGADLVLELPMPYAISSAEYFALGSVNLLHKLGVVDTLCFGMEKTDLEMLETLIPIIADEPILYQNTLKAKLAKGVSYPKAQQEALQAYDSHLDVSRLNSPNNRLALESLKALRFFHSDMKPCPVLRIGKGYDDTGLSKEGLKSYSSATAIRSHISSLDLNLSESGKGERIQVLKEHVPSFVWSDLQNLLYTNEYILPKDMDLILHFKLLQQSIDSLQSYLDISEDIANKIINALPYYSGFDTFCEKLKSKDLTYTRISRLLLHILLDLKKSDLELLKSLDYIPYGRILGFRKDATLLLHQIKENSTLPLISKLADAHKILSKDAFMILEKEISASHIYEALLSHKSKSAVKNEFTRQIIIL